MGKVISIKTHKATHTTSDTILITAEVGKPPFLPALPWGRGHAHH